MDIKTSALTKTVSDFDVQTNTDDGPMTFMGTENRPLTELGDHIVMVVDQAFVSDVTTFSTSVPVALPFLCLQPLAFRLRPVGADWCRQAKENGLTVAIP